MESNAKPQTEQMLAQLWEKHRSTIQERIALLQRAISELRSAELQPSTRDECRNAAHKLAGSLGTFGFHEATELARAIEEMMSKEVLTDQDRVRFAQNVEEISQLTNGPSTPR